MSCWLMIINVFFFDYGSGTKENQNLSNNTGAGAVAAKFPASLSTNAALMASTVLASRLKSTTHVFSLTLFSIEVFGLFPVFRRHLRAISWRGHVLLTVSLVIAAGAAVGVTLKGGYKGMILGILIGAPSTARMIIHANLDVPYPCLLLLALPAHPAAFPRSLRMKSILSNGLD
ncbi:phosphatidylinositol N-acetylglucosaminyltransferase subunit C [Coccidioides immitis H538.4]|uniref:Phosphatidylinositol N-acetylglucosaminyltransferase subunit C n=1 Tax=Coccidioides immitis H538.4 TaxID=396776 RepID=A0A0J8UBA5_COCIT|nr:phosphatidylinositol N-acetylglucosaminyltransferase subunit C [Coccidioides immitis H538.4]